jgi:hypothetical protein
MLAICTSIAGKSRGFNAVSVRGSQRATMKSQRKRFFVRIFSEPPVRDLYKVPVL